VAAAGPLLAACGAGEPTGRGSSGGRLPVHSDEVIWADFGGVTREVRKKVFFDPFTKEYGVPVRIADASYPKFITGAKRHTPTYDSIDLEGYQLVSLVDDHDVHRLPERVRRCDLIEPQRLRDYTGGGYAYSYGMTFKKSTFGGNQPTEPADFFDLKRFPGKRSMSKSVSAATAELALMADGVPPDKLYPLDLKRAYAKYDEIKDHILFYEQYAQGSQFLTQGAASILLTANGRAFELQQKGVDVVFQWNRAVLFPWAAAPVPKGAPHPDAMYALLDFMDRPDRQAAFAKALRYGPTVRKALDLVAPKVLDELPNSPEHAKIAATVDLVALGRQSDAYDHAFQDFVAGV
jgi:putative spermidine/putrescine transport system substrate-binding protein